MEAADSFETLVNISLTTDVTYQKSVVIIFLASRIPHLINITYSPEIAIIQI
jgi:hypothetical protein